MYIVFDLQEGLLRFDRFIDILKYYDYSSFRELYHCRPALQIFKIKEFIYNGID